MAKICEYNRGRQLIHKLTGNVGVAVIDAAESIVAKHSGKVIAADVVLQLYKIICKAGVLILEKEMTDEVSACSCSTWILMPCFCLYVWNL